MVKNTLNLKLNEEQLQAIQHKNGPLLIIAGAGTGKTTVVTERIKYLIEKNLALPSQILALTFTEKAAREMEERVDVALPYGYTDMWISTFHSFGDRILRDNALHIGYDPRYKLMTEASTVQFIRSHIFDFKLQYFRPLGNPTKFIAGMIQHFSRLQDENINSAEYLDWVKSKYSNSKLSDEEEVEREKYMELGNAYTQYEYLKVKESLMDFGDLIFKSLELFKKRPNILQEYKKRFKYILVDEFQDTNFAQNELIKTLTGTEGNITVVADDDQSIYRFRGAAVSNVIQFRKSYPKTKIIVLTKNYRSNQEILDNSYALIQHNNPDRLEVVENINKRLVSLADKNKRVVTRKESAITFVHKDRVENEADGVAKEIKTLVSQNQLLKYGDVAVLVRANNHADPFIRAFQRQGVPYQFLGPGKLFKQEEIIELISYLKVLYNVDDSSAFYKLLSIDYFGVDPKDLVRITNHAKRLNLSLFEAAESVDDIYVAQGTKEKVKKITDLINSHFKLIKNETAGQILYFFLEQSGLMQKFINPDTPDAQKRATNISKFFDKLKTYEVEHEDATIPAVVDWIELSSELGESPLSANEDWTKINAVNILTAHSAKGLEFPVVFLVNLVSQRFPTMERREQIPIPEEIIKEVLPQGDYHMEEERRLFYVGMTRAKEKLYLTAADYYGEGKREKKLSPFIFEALGDNVVGSEKSEPQGEQLSFLDYHSASGLAVDKEHTKTNQRLTNDFHVDYLSYSQIETFKTCPMHYKLKYISRIPTPPSAAQSFGISIHAALKNFYLGVKTGENPEVKYLLHLLKTHWIKEGYTSKKHQEEYFEKGERVLSSFFIESFNKNNLPELLEQKFTLPLPYKPGERPLKIGGVMDRVDLIGGSLLEIVDYKTAEKIPDQKDVDQNLQLTFYALAGSILKETPFQKNPDDLKLTLFYLDKLAKITTKRTREDLNSAIGEIYQVRKEIEESDFKCSGHIFCQMGCEFSMFCKTES